MKFNEFGEKLTSLRIKKGLNYKQVVEELEMRGITTNDIKNWERGLAHPNMNIIRKLAEIYEEPYEELLLLHEQTIQFGVDSIQMGFIQKLSKMMGVSMYTLIVLLRIMLVMVCIIGLLLFIQSMQKFVELGQTSF